MPTPNVREMVRRALIEGGYDGLRNPDGCGCVIDDLSPADCLTEQCQAGYRLDPAGYTAEEMSDNFGVDDFGEYDFYIIEEKPK